MNQLKNVPLILWIVLGVVLTVQASWIYLDAARRGENKWLWGIFGVLNTPTNLIIYLIVTRVILKYNPCTECGKNIRGNYKFCPHCGLDINNKDKE